MKRTYYQNQEIKLHNGIEISVATAGSTYMRDKNGSCTKLESLWLPVAKTLYVYLHDGTQVRLKNGKKGLEECKEGELVRPWSMDLRRLAWILSKRKEKVV